MKRDLQLLILAQLRSGRYKIEFIDDRVIVLGPDGRERKQDLSDGYPKVGISLRAEDRVGFKNRRPNVYVHQLVVLNSNLSKLHPDQALEEATFPEDFDIDHKNRNKLDNRPCNLVPGYRSNNQRNKVKRQSLTPFQVDAIRQIFKAFPDMNVREFSSYIDRSKGEVASIVRAHREEKLTESRRSTIALISKESP